MLEYFWDSRPSALDNPESYRKTSVWQLHEWYQNDSKNCYERSGKRSKSGKQEKKECKVEQRCQLRTCQWNINDLCYACDLRKISMHQAAKHVFEALINVESDVIILNEFGSPFQEGVSDLKRHLENAAYSVYVAPGTFPAAIASRLPVSDVKGFSLDEYRNAVGVSVTCTDGKIARVYGTHLEDSDSDDGVSGSTKSKRYCNKSKLILCRCLRGITPSLLVI